jgi:hypothetical protein
MNGRIIPFAGVAQSPERRSARPEVAGKIPAPRSILPFPRPHRVPRVEPLLIAVVGCFAGIALVCAGMLARAGGIVFGVWP